MATGTINALTQLIGNTLPLLTGEASSSTAEVHVFNGSKDLGKATVLADSTWTFQVPSSVKDGKLSFSTRELVGNKLDHPSGPVAYTLDTKPPAAPTVDAIKLPTNNATPTLTGKAEKDTIVKISANGVILGSAIADAKGVWKLEDLSYVGELTDEGANAITATATDAAGNTSVLSKSVLLNFDTTPPFAPTMAALPSLFTKVATQKLAGTAEAGTKVQIFGGVAGDKPLLAKEVVADKNGNWTASIKLAEGEHILTAEATDVAGHKSSASDSQTLTIDTKAPDAPIVTTPSVLIAAKQLPATLSGTAEAYAWVEVFAGAISLGKTQADGGGAWELDPPVPVKPLSDGVQKITAKATDAAGNVSKASTANVSATIDNKPPTAPTVDAIKPPKEGKPNLTGKTEVGATVKVFANGAELELGLGTVTVDAKGVWTLEDVFGKIATEGNYNITAIATDAAGNISAATAKPLFLSVDKTAPSATLVLAKTIDKVTTQKLTGTAEAGAKVQIYSDQSADPAKGLLAKEVVADKAGNWTASVTLAHGTHKLTVTATDAAGNTSAKLSEKTLIIDTVAPLQSTLVLAAPAKSIDKVVPTALSGTMVLDPTDVGVTTVNVYANSILLGTAIVDNLTGNWILAEVDYKAGVIKDGVKTTLSVKAIDAAGNISPVSMPVQFTLDSKLDEEPPVFKSASVMADTNKIVLTYDEALSTNKAAPIDFEVKVGGFIKTVNDVTVVGKTVVLTLTDPIETGNVVTVGYLKSPEVGSVTKTNTAIQDLTGNDAPVLSATPVQVALLLNSVTDKPITGYTLATDTIQLSKAVFKALGSATSLTEDFKSFATEAALGEATFNTTTTVAEHIVYIEATGKLYYNADSAKAGGLVLIGTFTNTPGTPPTLTAAEFEIV